MLFQVEAAHYLEYYELPLYFCAYCLQNLADELSLLESAAQGRQGQCCRLSPGCTARRLLRSTLCQENWEPWLQNEDPSSLRCCQEDPKTAKPTDLAGPDHTSASQCQLGFLSTGTVIFTSPVSTG